MLANEKNPDQKGIMYAFIVLALLNVGGVLVHKFSGLTLIEWIGGFALKGITGKTQKIFIIVSFFAMINLELALVLWLTPKVKWMKKAGPFTWALILAILATNLYIIPRSIGMGVVGEKTLDLQKIIFEIGLPLSIALLLLEVDLKAVAKSIGLRPFLMFLIGSLGTVVGGFVVAFLFSLIFHDQATLSESLKAVAGKIGAWIGGSENSAAVAVSGLKMSGEFYSYYALAGILPYALYITFLFSLGGNTSLIAKINGFIKPKYNAQILAEQYRAEVEEKELPKKIHERNFFVLASAGLLVLLLAFAFEARFGSVKVAGVRIGSFLPAVIVATTIALVVGAFTNVKKLPFLRPVGMYFLYLTIFVYIATKTNFAKLAGSTHIVFIMMASWFLILAIHLLIVVLGAKLIKVDWSTAAIASTANIGGGVTAPLCATAYDVEELVPISVMMAAIGYAIATYIGYYLGLLFLGLWAAPL